MAARIASLCTALVFLVSSSAHAALIDFGDVVRDTSSGLDWLLGDYDTVDGWTYATGPQLCGLFAAYALPPSPCPGGYSTEAPGNANEAVIDLFGPTEIGPNSNAIAGYFFAPGFGLGFAYLDYNFTNDRSTSGVFKDATSGGLPVGWFLVRPIPEPGTAALVFAGLLVLAARDRASRLEPL